jgi:hypothetical protein
MNSWKPPQYRTRFCVNEHSTNAFPFQRTFNSFPWIPLDNISGHAEKNDSFVLEWAGSSFVNEKSCVILCSSFVEEVADS